MQYLEHKLHFLHLLSVYLDNDIWFSGTNLGT